MPVAVPTRMWLGAIPIMRVGVMLVMHVRVLMLHDVMIVFVRVTLGDMQPESDVRWHLRKDGSRVFIDGRVTTLVDDGELRGFIKIGRDVTDRMEADQKLGESEERLRLAVGIGGVAALGCASSSHLV